ncbi:hypothetical protein JVT61DRAFT_10320 [Boletus reticuloceps]|uniref:Uncharacterized protein n=1 Tax=Boletus reticuloceps TaxID=495285 RepID=A0A8I2YWK1_9AGAM|nr:hypothetical protein JVT61DRAFT_10320 [Boletus reticuloceps]
MTTGSASPSSTSTPATAHNSQPVVPAYNLRLIRHWLAILCAAIPSMLSSSEPHIATNSFCTATDSSTSSSDVRKTVTGTLTDEAAFEFMSGGSNTQIVHRFHSSYTSSSPLFLSKSQGIQRRHHSRGYISNKENAASGYTASQSRSSSWTRSRSTTPTPAPSTATLSALEILDGSGSEGYETANSPSTASFKSLSSIPSETDYATVKQCKTEASTEFHTADHCQCASEVSSEYVIAEKCKTEASTKFYTAEKCKSETATKNPLRDHVFMQDNPIRGEYAALIGRRHPCRKGSDTSSNPPPPLTEVPSLQSPESDIHPELPPESVPLPPSEISPTISSTSRDLESEHIEETPAPHRRYTESSEFVMSDLPVSEEGLPSPAPLATTESSPSIHPSQWAPETDISYESSQLQPTPLTQSLQIQDGCDTSFETSIMRPSVSPLTSFGSLTAITETITTSAASTPPPPPSPPPPLPAIVIQTVISPSSRPTPLSLTSTASLSLSRTPSSVSSISSLSSKISLAEDNGISLADVPPPSEVSTEPSLLSSLHSPSISSVHYSPQPTRVPPPEISLSDHFPAPSPSVSSDTLQTNQPSIHLLETVQTQTHTECTEVITHEIDRLLHHIHELDHLRSQERQEIPENI